MNCRYILFTVFTLIGFYSCISDQNQPHEKTNDLSTYLSMTDTISDPAKVLRSAYGELKIIYKNLPNKASLYYDTCQISIVEKHMKNNDGKFRVNVVDFSYLDRFSRPTQGNQGFVFKQWHFLRSDIFNQMQALYEIEDPEKAKESLARFYKIKNERFLIVLTEKTKILPRTQNENYVLGGMFHGGAYIYDLETLSALCYFNFRFGNLYNQYEKYDTAGVGIYKAMIGQLEEQINLKLKEAFTAKTGYGGEVLDLQF